MTDEHTDIRVVLCTCPDQEAERIARAVLDKRLAACVNIVGGVKSLYWWKDNIEKSDETLLIIKVPTELYPELERHLVEVHPYDTPEVLALDVVDGSRSYISWVRDIARA